MPYQRTQVFQWHKRVSQGSKDMEDDKQPGCQGMMRTDENLEKVGTLATKDFFGATARITPRLPHC